MSPPAFLFPEIAKRFRGLNPGNASHFTGRKQEGGRIYPEAYPENIEEIFGMFRRGIQVNNNRPDS